MSANCTVRYNCTENDNYILAEVVDGKVDELHFGCGDGYGSLLVFGIKDVRRALRDFDQELKV